MKKGFTLLLAVAMLALFVLPSAVLAEEEKVLNVLTWEGYIDGDTIINPFTAETGIKINYATFSSNEEMLTKLQAVDGGEYDIILASDYVLGTAREAGLLLPLSKDLLPNFANIKEGFLNQGFDPESAYVVPYIGGTPLIVYDPALVDFEITGYEDLWNPALKDSIVVMDDARNIIGITLKTLGQSFNTTDREILAQAKEKLMQLRGNIRVFDYDTADQQMLSGETTVGYMFTPHVVTTLAERPDMKVVYPKEGVGIGIDGLVIPVRAPHPENAHLFLDFLMRPEIAVHIADVQMYTNANAAAEPLLPQTYVDNLAINIPAERLDDAEFIEGLSVEDESFFQEIWMEFKQQ